MGKAQRFDDVGHDDWAIGFAWMHSSSYHYHFLLHLRVIFADHYYGDTNSCQCLTKDSHFSFIFNFIQILQKLAIRIGNAVCELHFFIFIYFKLKRKLIKSIYFHPLIQKLVFKFLLLKCHIGEAVLRPFIAAIGKYKRI